MRWPKLKLLASNGVATFVMPFSIALNARHTHIKQTHTCIHRHTHTTCVVCVYVRVLSRLFLGGAAPPYCANIPPFSVSEAAAPPIIKNDAMQSRSVFNNYIPNSYTHASTQRWYAIQLLQIAKIIIHISSFLQEGERVIA